MGTVKPMDDKDVFPGRQPSVDIQEILVTYIYPLLEWPLPAHETLIYISSLCYSTIKTS